MFPSLKVVFHAARGAAIAAAVAGRVAGAQASSTVPPARADRAMTLTIDSVNWKAVDSAVGRPSVVQPGDVHRNF